MTPSATSVPTELATPTATATSPPTATATATPTEELTASATATATATATSLPTETATPESGPVVTRLVLVDADTDTDIGELTDGATLDLATLPTRNLNIRAETEPSVVGSVWFGLNDNPTFRIENGSPYSLAGDSDGDYHPWTPSPGSHTVTARAVTDPNAQGTSGPGLTIGFTVVDSSVPTATPTLEPPRVTRFILVDADTDTDLGELTDGAILDLATLPTRSLNVLAETEPEIVGSVRFDFDDEKAYRIENGEPYAFAGNREENFHPWVPSLGNHTLTATAYTGPSATGTAGPELTVQFTIIDSSVEPAEVSTATDDTPTRSVTTRSRLPRSAPPETPTPTAPPPTTEPDSWNSSD